MLIKVPTRFFDDHQIDRCLPSPAIVKATKAHYFIDSTDPNMGELRDDAEYYADPNGPEDAGHLKAAAKALLKAIDKQARNA